MTPLFELHKHKKLPTADQSASICEELEGIWGIDRPFFLDTIWLHSAGSEPEIVKTVFDAARYRQLQAIPVVRTGIENATVAAVRGSFRRIHAQYLLRLNRGDLQNAAGIKDLVTALGIPPRSVHLMIDYRSAIMNLAADVPRIPVLNQWKTFAAASGVFPKKSKGPYAGHVA